ncbi:hypothetical protein ACM46_07130 [Chryseobacterium angstadtii]|uniref:Uncharacterized protein n=1 Tax=Chryseobacterium angstadtii TaxID=558151 RepID=A0A0J7II24_9FLAO|nr:hypothetical protein [Chryseobacterium angstadtii]KMQ65639.1 hypothetical protein ACM46_07130 [Chryseobacterium angstadtii]
MTEKFKKISDTFFTVLGGILVGGGIIFLVFIENPVRYFFYTVLLVAATNFKNFRNFKIDFKKAARGFLITTAVIYLSLITVLSVSPFLKIMEFKWSHSDWKPVNAQTIQPFTSWDTGYKRKGNSFVNIDYEYQFSGTTYKNSESEALYQYYPFWNRETSQDLVKEFSKSVSEKIQKRDYLILTNPDQPEKSKLFLSTDLLYFQGSLFYDAVTGFAALILIFLAIIGAVFMWPRKRRK